MSKNKQTYILEMNGFTEDESREFLNIAFSRMEFGSKGLTMSHLTKKGVEDLNEYVLSAEATE